MIPVSNEYKLELQKIAKRIKNSIDSKNLSDTILFDIEKEIFLSAYYIRKLLEASKLSLKISNFKLQVLEYKAYEECFVTKVNGSNIEKHYDLKSYIKTYIPLRKYINLIIHSYCLCISENNDSFDGFFFNSDKIKNEKLYFIKIQSLITLINKVSFDSYNHSANILCLKRRDYVTFNSNSSSETDIAINKFHSKFCNKQLCNMDCIYIRS